MELVGAEVSVRLVYLTRDSAERSPVTKGVFCAVSNKAVHRRPFHVVEMPLSIHPCLITSVQTPNKPRGSSQSPSPTANRQSRLHKRQELHAWSAARQATRQHRRERYYVELSRAELQGRRNTRTQCNYWRTSFLATISATHQQSYDPDKRQRKGAQRP